MNLLILSSSTGGGHEMRANALKSWWTEEKGQARILRPLENGFKLYRWGTSLYNTIQKIFPFFITFIFIFWNTPRFIGDPDEFLAPKDC